MRIPEDRAEVYFVFSGSRSQTSAFGDHKMVEERLDHEEEVFHTKLFSTLIQRSGCETAGRGIRGEGRDHSLLYPRMITFAGIIA